MRREIHTEAAFNTAHFASILAQRCAHRHPDKLQRGPSAYGLPKGWCGLGLAIDTRAFDRLRIFEEWAVAFHGTRVDTAVAILQQADWQLLLPGDVTASGVKIPIRAGHIKKPFRRVNSHTGEQERFDPRQIFTSPSVRYCSHGGFYCDSVAFEGQEFMLAFQARACPPRCFTRVRLLAPLREHERSHRQPSVSAHACVCCRGR